MKARKHPLLRLLANSRRYRGRLVLATSFSILNKIFDVMPPMLIGAAIYVVVRREESFLANLGLVEMQVQLLALCALTMFVWVMESLFDYVQHIYWRNLSQTIEHDLRLEAYDHVQQLEMAWFEDRSTGRLLSILNDDINQLERFLGRRRQLFDSGPGDGAPHRRPLRFRGAAGCLAGVPGDARWSPGAPSGSSASWRPALRRCGARSERSTVCLPTTWAA